MNKAISNLLKKPLVFPVSVVAAGAGASIGYLIGKKIVEKQENKTSEDVYSSNEKDVEVYVMDIPENLNETSVVLHDLADLKNVVEEEGYFDYSKGPDMVDNETEVPEEDIFLDEPSDGEAFSPEIVVSVFSDSDDDWDYAKEDKIRDANPDGPYVIHEDEYIRNDLGYRQETLTYYSKDEILADENGQLIYNFKKMTGELQFGHGSNDENIVYIRNAGLRMEWEILFHNGWFTKEVAGIDIEDTYESEDLKHGNTPRKFKGEY